MLCLDLSKTECGENNVGREMFLTLSCLYAAMVFTNWENARTQRFPMRDDGIGRSIWTWVVPFSLATPTIGEILYINLCLKSRLTALCPSLGGFDFATTLFITVVLFSSCFLYLCCLEKSCSIRGQIIGVWPLSPLAWHNRRLWVKIIPYYIRMMKYHININIFKLSIALYNSKFSNKTSHSHIYGMNWL